MKTDLMFSSGTNKWETPQWLFDRLNQIFCFEIDVCADETNHKCDRYFTEEDDGLKQMWGGTEYGAILRMVGRLAYGSKKQPKLFWTINLVSLC